MLRQRDADREGCRPRHCSSGSGRGRLPADLTLGATATSCSAAGRQSHGAPLARKLLVLDRKERLVARHLSQLRSRSRNAPRRRRDLVLRHDAVDEVREGREDVPGRAVGRVRGEHGADDAEALGGGRVRRRAAQDGEQLQRRGDEDSRREPGLGRGRRSPRGGAVELVLPRIPSSHRHGARAVAVEASGKRVGRGEPFADALCAPSRRGCPRGSGRHL